MIDNEMEVDDQATYTLDQIIAEFVRTPGQRQRFLRTGWVR